VKIALKIAEDNVRNRDAVLAIVFEWLITQQKGSGKDLTSHKVSGTQKTGLSLEKLNLLPKYPLPTPFNPPPKNPRPTKPPTTGEFRLNTDLLPQAYTLRLVPHVHNSSIRGLVDITFSVNRPTNVITFNGVNISIIYAELTKSGQSEQINSVHTDLGHQIIRIETASTLQLYSEYNLTLTYEGQVRDDLLGFHAINASKNHEEK